MDFCGHAQVAPKWPSDPKVFLGPPRHDPKSQCPIVGDREFPLPLSAASPVCAESYEQSSHVRIKSLNPCYRIGRF